MSAIAKIGVLDVLPDSAVRVLPTPGAPERRMTIPPPINGLEKLVRCLWRFSTLSINHIVKCLAIFELTLDKCKDQIFITIRKYKTVKRLCIELDFLDMVDFKLS